MFAASAPAQAANAIAPGSFDDWALLAVIWASSAADAPPSICRCSAWSTKAKPSATIVA